MQNFLRDLIRQAGRLTLDYRARLDTIAVHYKNKKELVTEADEAVERFIIDRIRSRYPNHAFWGEESGQTAGDDYRWVIDPIDGTASFVHDQPYYSVSIALEYQGQTQLGAVFAPVLNELFEAQLGHGATLNGRPIRVSDESDLGYAMLATGFACQRVGSRQSNLPYFNALLPRINGIRRMGSAALDLCYVAAGRLDGFWELNLNLYDVAAGALILTEAGGTLSDFTAPASLINYPAELLATNTPLHTPILSIFHQVAPPQP